MTGRPWKRNELILAMNLYCRLPFGQLHAGNRDVIALASVLDRSPSSVAMKLGNLASLDPAHQERGVRGLTKVSAGDRAIWDEFHADWNRLAAESESLRERMHRGTEAERVPPDEWIPPEFVGETEETREVRVRLAQRFFRRAIMVSYGSRCCVTGIGVPSLLVASHILPWSRFPLLRADPRNGLCLSKLHDAAFDRGLITFDNDYRLIVSERLRNALENPVLASSFSTFEGKAIRLAEKFRPNPDFLRAHRETVFQCSTRGDNTPNASQVPSGRRDLPRRCRVGEPRRRALDAKCSPDADDGGSGASASFPGNFSVLSTVHPLSCQAGVGRQKSLGVHPLIGPVP